MFGKCAVILSAMALHLVGASAINAGEASRLPRIGVLIPESGRSETQSVKGLRDGLKELGYKERENILVEMRDAKGDRAALKPMANELVSKKVDLIFTTGTRSTAGCHGCDKRDTHCFPPPGEPADNGFGQEQQPAWRERHRRGRLRLGNDRKEAGNSAANCPRSSPGAHLL